MFTYRDYYDLITSLSDVKLFLRHDVDISLDKALEMAQREKKMGVGPAIYYILLTSDFYNPLENQNQEKIFKILDLGHGIGLHYDLTTMPKDDELRSRIIVTQASTLEGVFNTRVTTIAHHKPVQGLKPSQILLEALDSVQLADPVLTLKDYKYISDSGMNFREDPYEVSKYHRLVHLNIHPVWWDTKEGTYQDRLFDLELDFHMKQKVYNEIKLLKTYHAIVKQPNNRS